MLKRAIFCFAIISNLSAFAQQYPYWTQFRSNLLLLNPAVSGTRKDFDARMNYRYQWAGFEGAPKTIAVSAHGSLFNNALGVGGYIYQDQLGPSKFISVSSSNAFHVKFEDSQLSMGIGLNYSTQRIDPYFMKYFNSQDNIILNAVANPKASSFNGSFGLLYFNDRFQFGLGANNLFGNAYEFKGSEGSLKSVMSFVPHYNFLVGYNWAEDPAFVWENNLLMNFVSGAPFMIDYNVRLHIKESFFVGAGWRLKTAIIGQVGYTFNNMAQISYSYDYSTNNLKYFNSGTHEISLVYTYDKSSRKGRNRNSRFLKQKFGYLL